MKALEILKAITLTVDEDNNEWLRLFSQHSMRDVEKAIAELEASMREKDLKIEYLQNCIDTRSEYDKKYGEQA